MTYKEATTYLFDSVPSTWGALTVRARAAIHWQPYFKPQVTKWAFIRHLT